MYKKSLRKKSQLTDMHQSLSDILGVERLDQLVGLSRLRKRWKAIVGPMLGQRTEPYDLKRQADGSYHLVIAVTHSTMAQGIQLLRDDIRKACFEQAHISRIAKIFTHVQNVAGINDEKVKIIAKPVTLEQKKLLASGLQNIKNNDLRHAMFDARLAQLRYSNEDIYP